MPELKLTITDEQDAAMRAAGVDPTERLQVHVSYEAGLFVRRAFATEMARIGLPANVKDILDDDQAAFVIADATAKQAAKEAAIAAFKAAEAVAAQLAADEAAAAEAAAMNP